MPNTPVSIKRPLPVWLITIFYGAACALSLVSFWLLSTNRIPLNAAQSAYFASLGNLDWLATIAIGALGVCGSIALFLLKRSATLVFGIALALNLLLTIVHAVRSSWVEALGPGGVAGAFSGWAILLAFLVYSRYLRRKGLLR